MWANLAKTSAIGLISGYLIWLSVSGGLNIYIHPRYHSFTLIMAVLAAGFTLSDLCWQLWRRYRKRSSLAWSRSLGRPQLLSLITVAIVLLGISLPPRPLSLHAVNQRAPEQQSFIAESNCHPPETNAAGQTLLYRWLSAVQACEQPAELTGHNLTLIGFITERPDKPDSFWLTRFVVSCCAVDSTPLRVEIIAPQWRARYAPGQWLRVSGTTVRQSDGSMVITSATLTPITEPDTPYEFLGSLE
ncbi:MAG: TIGR03943 family protein [Candidatus Saccharibacteria bacterium]|nr:TIGR03943 family protein [Candidatus Saccharibacteria bacterium]